MVKTPEDILYTRTHQWARYENGVISVGITDFAQEQLGEIVYVELRWDDGLKGAKLNAVTYDGNGEPASNPIDGVSVESQKAVGDIYSPATGEVVEVNETLKDSPEKINSEPYKAWLFKLKPANWDADKKNLLDAAAYKAVVAKK